MGFCAWQVNCYATCMSMQHASRHHASACIIQQLHETIHAPYILRLAYAYEGLFFHKVTFGSYTYFLCVRTVGTAHTYQYLVVPVMSKDYTLRTSISYTSKILPQRKSHIQKCGGLENIEKKIMKLNISRVQYSSTFGAGRAPAHTSVHTKFSILNLELK
jgi:hypothetical protein